MEIILQGTHRARSLFSMIFLIAALTGVSDAICAYSNKLLATMPLSSWLSGWQWKTETRITEFVKSTIIMRHVRDH